MVREILATETDLIDIIDFGPNEVFEGTSAYVGAIVAQKRHTDTSQRRATVRVVVVSDVSDTRYLGGTLTEALTQVGEFRTEALSAFDISRPISSAPWVLLAPSALLARINLEQTGQLLGDFAGIFQGIRTGANDIFILQVDTDDGSFANAVNLLGDPAILDTALLHPVVFGSDIQRYDIPRPQRMLLYPYRRGMVISEGELRDEYPSTYKYLATYRHVLSNRSSIRASGLHWYELVRRRNDTWLSSGKLLTRDLATHTSFTPDQGGGVFLVGGTAVVPSDPQYLLPLLAYLNSAVVNEYLMEATPSFRGGFQKFEPQHLGKIPVPLFLTELDAEAIQIGELARAVLYARLAGHEENAREAEGEIDRIVADAVNPSA